MRISSTGVAAWAAPLAGRLAAPSCSALFGCAQSASAEAIEAARLPKLVVGCGGRMEIGGSITNPHPYPTTRLYYLKLSRMLVCSRLLPLLLLYQTWAGEPTEPDGRIPQRSPSAREISDSGVGLADAQKMPWFPTHTSVCGGRSCRPGEGNLRHTREETARGWRYKQWTQPYLHREAWVQARRRSVPHRPDPRSSHYAPLVAAARRVACERLVMLTSGDWDYRELVLNWALHLHALGHSNTLVLAMDSELHEEMRRKEFKR